MLATMPMTAQSAKRHGHRTWKQMVWAPIMCRMGSSRTANQPTSQQQGMQTEPGTSRSRGKGQTHGIHRECQACPADRR